MQVPAYIFMDRMVATHLSSGAFPALSFLRWSNMVVLMMSWVRVRVDGLPRYRLVWLYYFISLPSSINSDINSAGGWYIEGRVVRAYTDGYWYAVDVEFSF